jgi:hypothetical protein
VPDRVMLAKWWGRLVIEHNMFGGHRLPSWVIRYQALDKMMWDVVGAVKEWKA